MGEGRYFEQLRDAGVQHQQLLLAQVIHLQHWRVSAGVTRR
jgi:hypothetical protein